ncbi:hypothetical protein T01_6625 [Trichinella spiralis]|uniref:Uncharacterized protein n=1 Tax=Trichinella spiralis TaxID=6334 RepID=A0A0V1BRS4_TRISP|nr:hypothetical protein T01_6625 [Trichinella spiralis]
MFYTDFIMRRCYPALPDSISCATSNGAPSPRIAIIHLPHHRLKTDRIPGGSYVLFCSCHCANLPDEATPAGSTGRRLPFDPISQHLRFRNPGYKLLDMPKHSLAKVEEATLHLGVGKVALNSWDQGCFEIAKKRRGIKLQASFFT